MFAAKDIWAVPAEPHSFPSPPLWDRQDFQAQKEELEGVVARNMQFINALLVDKEALNAQVAGLSTELKQLAEKHDKKVPWPPSLQCLVI